jgi:ribosomal protein S4
MGLHKIRPRLKNYSKTKIFLKPTQLQKLAGVKKNLKVYSPDVTYLNSKWANKLERYFANILEERRKLKFFFGFHRTSLLKKIVKVELSKKTKVKYALKELEFCSILERRLDLLLFRLGFVPTIFAAKQLISHKKVKVNNYANSSFSRLVKKGDVISFDSSVYLTVQSQLKKQLKNDTFYLNNSNQVEINFKTLKLVILTTKINLFSQIPQYMFSLK